MNEPYAETFLSRLSNANVFPRSFRAENAPLALAMRRQRHTSTLYFFAFIVPPMKMGGRWMMMMLRLSAFAFSIVYLDRVADQCRGEIENKRKNFPLCRRILKIYSQQATTNNMTTQFLTIHIFLGRVTRTHGVSFRSANRS